MDVVSQNVEGVFSSLSAYFQSLDEIADGMLVAQKTGIQLSVQDYPYMTLRGYPKSIILQNTELGEHRICIFKLDTLRPHPFLENVQILDAPLSMGLKDLTGAEKFRLYIPCSEDGQINLAKSFVEYQGLELPRRLKHVLSAVVDKQADKREIQQISFQTFLSEGFNTGYNQAFEEFQPVYGGATFDVSAKRSPDDQGAIEAGVEKFNAIIRSYVHLADIAIKEASDRHALIAEA